MNKRTKFLLGIGVIAALVFGWQIAAFAVHDEVFQLEGNAVDDAGATLPPEDWANVNNNTDTATVTNFVSEPNGVVDTYFTGGQTGDETDLPNWLWTSTGGGANDKTNLRDSFAALYKSGTAPNDKELLYFGADRFDASGSAAVGFWFFQNEVGLDPAPPPEGTATSGDFSAGTPPAGTHKDGDILILSDFTTGGTVSTIKVLQWDGPGGTGTLAGACTSKSQNPGPGQCAAKNLRVVMSSGGTAGNTASCTGPPTNDNGCAIVNSSTQTSPWTFADKDGNTSFQAGEFFEGGIDLKGLGLGGRCFSSVMAEGRTSAEVNSVLKDFTLSSFGACASGTSTVPTDNAGTAIGANGISIGTGEVKVRDEATITVPSAPTWQGNVTFHLCGPIASGTCTTGGELIGNPVPVSNTTLNGKVLSDVDAARVTSAGRYCWRADFVPTNSPGVVGSSDSSTTECFTVNPVTPTLATTAGPDVNLGTAVTDNAALSGTATQPGKTAGVTDAINPATPGAAAGGEITFKLYGPSDTGCGTLVFTSASGAFPVSGNGPYGPASYTPTAPGNYHWVAVYSGNSPNTNGTDHNTACTDTAEDVTVTSVASSMTTAQKWVPNDEATISAPQGGALDGSVTFQAFDTAGCTGTSIYGPQSVDVSGPSTGVTVTTTNTTALTASKNVFWRVSYDSDNPAQQDISAKCTESSNLTITNGSPQTSP